MNLASTIPLTWDSALPDWTHFLSLPDEELGKIDIAVVNLACAAGLPGSEVIDTAGCLTALDRWTVGIHRVTEQRLDTEFRSNPRKYDNSEPLFRLVTMALALKDQCGVDYDLTKRDAKQDDPFDLNEHFIYGPIQGPGGTCATLPLVHVAVGRRLGYPLRLVLSRGHMFCRWDEPAKGIRVNLDAACPGGVDCYPDDYYRIWPQPITPTDERLGGYLHSLTPRQELATFIGRRGIHWQELGNYRRAAHAYALASRLDNPHLHWPHNLRRLGEEWERKLKARRPAGFPKLEIAVRQDRRRWPSLPWDVEQRFRFLEAAENVLNDTNLEAKCWEPLRSGNLPELELPSKIVVDCTGEELCSIQP